MKFTFYLIILLIIFTISQVSASEEECKSASCRSNLLIKYVFIAFGLIVFIAVFVIVPLFIAFITCCQQLVFSSKWYRSSRGPEVSLNSVHTISTLNFRSREPSPPFSSRPPSYNSAVRMNNNSNDQLVPNDLCVAIESSRTSIDGDRESESTSDPSPPPYAECIRVPLRNAPGVYWYQSPPPSRNGLSVNCDPDRVKPVTI